MKIGVAPPPKPPKSLKTFGDYKKVKKTLDKPTKTVYNIRKDAGEVLGVLRKYVKKDYQSSLFSGFTLNIINRCDTVRYIAANADLPLPVLAGGCLRDLFYGKTPKDYDFFFNCDKEDEAYELMDKLTLSLGSRNFTEGGPSDKYGDEDAFEGVYGVFNYINGGIQFIVGAWPEAKTHIYNRFDLSVCQAQMDLDTFNIEVSDAFLETLATKEIKFLKENPSDYTKYRHDQFRVKLFTTNIRTEDPLTWILPVAENPFNELRVPELP